MVEMKGVEVLYTNLCCRVCPARYVCLMRGRDHLSHICHMSFSLTKKAPPTRGEAVRAAMYYLRNVSRSSGAAPFIASMKRVNQGDSAVPISKLGSSSS